MPVAAETKPVEKELPSVPVKKVDRARGRSRSRSRSRSVQKRGSKLNVSHNLSLSDLMNRSFGPDRPEFAEDDVEVQYYFWGAELSCASSTHNWRIFHPEDECETISVTSSSSNKRLLASTLSRASATSSRLPPRITRAR